jgi:hypothetical protein
MVLLSSQSSVAAAMSQAMSRRAIVKLHRDEPMMLWWLSAEMRLGAGRCTTTISVSLSVS